MDGKPHDPAVGCPTGARVDPAARVEATSRPGRPTDSEAFDRAWRYDAGALYNHAPTFALRPGLALPLACNFAPGRFLRVEDEAGGELPFYVEVPHESSPGSHQWDSFPAGETAQFLITSVDRESLTGAREGRSGERVNLRAASSSSAPRPFTLALTVSPVGGGPIPHVHWAEDEWFFVLQGEMDAWIGDPELPPLEIGDFPLGNRPHGYTGSSAEVDRIRNFYYDHVTPGRIVFLPRGHAHAYRNASPTGDPLIFLTIWSRTPGHAKGGIEQFFSLGEPWIGRFFDTAEEATSFGSLTNKTADSADGAVNVKRFVDYFDHFPKHYVAMSRNFGSFLRDGGNWNPPSPADATPPATVPPAHWVVGPDGDGEVCDADTPGAVPYYLPPEPNEPSATVNFQIPLFDPQIVELIDFGVDRDESAALAAARAYHSRRSSAAGVRLCRILRAQRHGGGTASTRLLTVWEKSSYMQAVRVREVEQFPSGHASTVLHTIDPNPAGPARVLILDEIQMSRTSREVDERTIRDYAAATQAVEGVEECTACVENSVDAADRWMVMTQFATTDIAERHLASRSRGALTDAFANALASATYFLDTRASRFLGVQREGIEELQRMLASLPCLALRLEIGSPGVLSVRNGDGTSGFGGVLIASLPAGRTDGATAPGRCFGVLEVDDAEGRLNGVAAADRERWLAEARSRVKALVGSSAGSMPRLYDRVAAQRAFPVRTSAHYVFWSAPFAESPSSGMDEWRWSLDAAAFLETQGLPPTSANVFGTLKLALGSPVTGLRTLSARRQERGEASVDLTRTPQRTVHFHVTVTSSAGAEVRSVGLVPAGEEEGSDDPSSGWHGIVAEVGTLSVDGGSRLQPCVTTKAHGMLTPSNCEVRTLGENVFEFVLAGSSAAEPSSVIAAFIPYAVGPLPILPVPGSGGGAA